MGRFLLFMFGLGLFVILGLGIVTSSQQVIAQLEAEQAAIRLDLEQEETQQRQIEAQIAQAEAMKMQAEAMIQEAQADVASYEAIQKQAEAIQMQVWAQVIAQGIVSAFLSFLGVLAAIFVGPFFFYRREYLPPERKVLVHKETVPLPHRRKVLMLGKNEDGERE